MNSRMLLLVLSVPRCPCAGGEDARLKDLQTRVAKQDFAGDKLRRDILTFAREQVGTPLCTKAIETLRSVPCPLDRLDENAIDADERKTLGIRELVTL